MKLDDTGLPQPETPVETADMGNLVPVELAMCRHYNEHGNMALTARTYNTTVYEVKKLMSTLWWQEETTRLKADARVKADAGYSRLMDLTIDALEDRVLKGELVGFTKDGTEKRVPLSATALCRINDLAFMKRQLLRNQPTAIPGDTPSMGVLAQKLRALGAKDPSLIVDMESGSVASQD